MNPHGNGKPEPTDPQKMLQALDIELMQLRSAREQAGSPYRAFRVASFLFLFAVIIGALLAAYFVFVSGGLDDFRSRKQPAATPASRAP
jgi:hypothetical protein